MGIFDSLIGDVKVEQEVKKEEEKKEGEQKKEEEQKKDDLEKKTYKNGVPVGLYSDKFYDYYKQKKE